MLAVNLPEFHGLCSIGQWNLWIESFKDGRALIQIEAFTPTVVNGHELGKGMSWSSEVTLDRRRPINVAIDECEVYLHRIKNRVRIAIAAPQDVRLRRIEKEPSK